ncbi:MAG: archaeosortase/exosortase family protein, partial [Nitrososphaerales archaeon]
MITSPDDNTDLLWRWVPLAAWIVLCSILFIRPVTALLRLSLFGDDASYILLIPFLSGWVFYVERKFILRKLSYDVSYGVAFLLSAMCIMSGTWFLPPFRSNDLQLTGDILALILLWIAGFAFFFGRAAARAAYFPLLFLFLTVPLPNSILDRVVYVLQLGSAAITGTLFD